MGISLKKNTHIAFSCPTRVFTIATELEKGIVTESERREIERE